jgi:hypothetical protein
MPTGYTSEILDGTTKTFQDFAKICMRALGATIHMRDEKLNEEYKPQKTNNYPIKRIKQDRKKLKEIQSLTDNEIIKQEKEFFEKHKDHFLLHNRIIFCKFVP